MPVLNDERSPPSGRGPTERSRGGHSTSLDRTPGSKGKGLAKKTDDSKRNFEIPDTPTPSSSASSGNMMVSDSERLASVEKTLDEAIQLLRMLVQQQQLAPGAVPSVAPAMAAPPRPQTKSVGAEQELRPPAAASTPAPPGQDRGRIFFDKEEASLPNAARGKDVKAPMPAAVEKRPSSRNSRNSRQFFDEDDEDEDSTANIKVVDDVGAKVLVLDENDDWMINPRNQFRMTWDLCVVMPFLVYLTWAMPFRLCFANEAPYGTPVYWWEFVIDMVFIIDIVLNFRTGYFVRNLDLGASSVEDNDLVEYDRQRVAKNYLKSWFVLDVVSGVPFALIEIVSGSGTSALKSAKTLKLLRFLKLGRLFKLEKILSTLDRDTLDMIEDFFQNGSTRSAVLMIQLSFYLGYVCHLLACGFVMIGRIGAQDPDADSWLENEMKGPFYAFDTTSEAPEGHVDTIYIAAFYFTLTTMTSVGYGDIVTRSNTERIYTILLEFVGAIVFAMIIANLTSIVSSMDMNARKTAEQLDAVSSFVMTRNFPEALGRRIRRHFRHFYSLKSAIDESKIFSELSTKLRKEVSSFLVAELMGSESFFMSMRPVLWPRLLPILRPMRFETDELICQQGEECTEMYVVLNGSLVGETRVKGEEDGQRVRHIAAGQSVNVLCVLGIWHRAVETVTAEVDVDSYAVSANDFASLFTSETDSQAFERMQWKEQQNFMMDTHHENSPTKYGRPLYFSCFSTVEVTLIQARGLLQDGDGGTQFLLSEGDRGTTFLIADLVDVASGKPFNEIWWHKTDKASPRPSGRGLSDREKRESHVLAEPFWGEVIRWTDVSVPFEKAAVRVRLFESMGHHHSDRLLGKVLLKLTDLEKEGKAFKASDAAAAKEHSAAQRILAEGRQSAGGPARLRSQSASILNGAEEWLSEQRPLKDAELESWFELDPNASTWSGDGSLSGFSTATGTTAASSSSSCVHLRLRAVRPEKKARSKAARNPMLPPAPSDPLRSSAAEASAPAALSAARAGASRRVTAAGRGAGKRAPAIPQGAL